MNRIDLYAAFISEQVYMDEVIGGSDKGFSYHKRDLDQTRDTADHEYEVDLPDNARPATVSISHMENSKKAGVHFDMPSMGYGISPEAKKTYKKVYAHHIEKEYPLTAHKHAVAAVGSSHGQEEAEKADKSWEDSLMASDFASHHAHRMLSTVGKILHEHGKNNPHIHAFTFIASGDKESRGTLYDAITKKYGGEKHYDKKDAEYYYTIPNPHHSGD